MRDQIAYLRNQIKNITNPQKVENKEETDKENAIRKERKNDALAGRKQTTFGNIGKTFTTTFKYFSGKK